MATQTHIHTGLAGLSKVASMRPRFSAVRLTDADTWGVDNLSSLAERWNV